MGAGPALLRVEHSSFFEEETTGLATHKEGSSPVDV